MGLRFRFDILSALKEKGWNTGRLRAENAEARARGEKASGLSEDTIQRLRKGKPISWANIENICKKLECQPGYFLEFVPDDEPTEQTKGDDIFTSIQKANQAVDERNNQAIIRSLSKTDVSD